MSSDNRKTYIYYITLYVININILRATQAFARVHVAEPRGLACHVASTWARANITPFFPII